MSALDDRRAELVLAALPHVAFDGWSRRAMHHAARDTGLDRMAADRAFPYGAADMVAAFSRLADRHMIGALEQRDLAAMKVRQRISVGVRTRLEEWTPHREAVRRGIAVFALPHNSGTAVRCLYDTVDAIWYAAGDTATDWNFYSKRALLAGVYSATTLYWLDDRSDGATDSWAFLDRRIDDVMRIPKVGARLINVRESMFRPVRAFCGASTR
ncbi:MAG: COQ9 family protein [Alphaproteobacteria bacterium]|nr:COQ9 family protein [Alphaproteobacteria bacterium]